MKAPAKTPAEVGSSSPLGATVSRDGVNFSMYSRSASGMELALFEREDEELPARTIRLDPATNRTSRYWHVFVEGIKPGQLYGYRAQGPFDPANGMPRRLNAIGFGTVLSGAQQTSGSLQNRHFSANTTAPLRRSCYADLQEHGHWIAWAVSMASGSAEPHRASDRVLP